MENNELQHHGILGQKWGVRRFQRKDGSLTSAGKKKYSSDDSISVELDKKLSDKSDFSGKLKNSSGAVVGHIYMERKKDGGYDLNWIDVRKKARGNGYAQKAIAQAIEHAKKNKASYISLEVPKGDEDAKHIYEKYGFTSDKKREQEHDPNGDGILEYMRKDLKHYTDDELMHYGVIGMKWGIRHDKQASGNSKKRNVSPKIKKAAFGIAATATIAAAGVYYARHKSSIDGFVKNYMAVNRQVKMRDMKKYADTHRDKIVKSASKLNKYKDFMKPEDVSKAKKTLELTRDLHNIQQDNIRRGASYVQAFLAYGSAATAAYNLANSQMVKKAKNKHKS